LEKERIDRHSLEKIIAQKKKTEEAYEKEKIRLKLQLEKERAHEHSLEEKLALLRKQKDGSKVDIKRLELLLKKGGAKHHKLVRDKYSDVKVGFSFAH
jgi:hypothetical protein